MQKSNTKIANITFIGAGIATSYTLISFLNKISNESTNSKKIVINIIDKFPEFFCGIPYGKRSGKTVLLINSLRSFLPEKERNVFITWLKENKKKLIEEFLTLGGEQSNRWYKNNQSDIEKDIWVDLFIPRSFFGRYIVEKVNEAIDQAKQKASIEINNITAEVLDVKKENQLFYIKLDNNDDELISNKIVLSVGSLPAKRIFTEASKFEDSNFLMINDIYNKSIDISFEEIEKFLSKNRNKKINALIIGANASGLETIYKLNNKGKSTNTAVNHFLILSTHGLMPDSEINYDLKSKFSPDNLINLQKEKDLTAKQIGTAAFLDIDNAEKINLGAASTVDIISQAFGSLLSKLSVKEKEIFACKYGNEIGRRQRCAGTHYTSIVSSLRKENKITHKAGRFHNILKNEDSNSYKIRYIDSKTKQETTYPEDINLVINCIGSINLENEKTPTIIKNLINKSFCTPNDSKIGFKVNEEFQTIENFYVAGPLLAGNVINDMPLWHLEHCGRIIWSSNQIGNSLAKQL